METVRVDIVIGWCVVVIMPLAVLGLAMWKAGRAERGALSKRLRIKVEQETDGRWIAEVTSVPGVMACGRTRREAVRRAIELAWQVIIGRMEAEVRKAGRM